MRSKADMSRLNLPHGKLNLPQMGNKTVRKQVDDTEMHNPLIQI